MEAFSELLEQLYFTSGNNAKAALIKDYLASTPDPDRGWAVAAIAGALKFDFFKRNTVKKLITERVDGELFAMSYDYVGEVSETVAHLWPDYEPSVKLPALSEIIGDFMGVSRNKVSGTLANYLSIMTPAQRWALLKLGTRGLRIGVSARSIKQILADYGNKDISDIETLWHGVKPPYTNLLLWLEDKGPIPDISDVLTFHPVMLSHPIEEKHIDDFCPHLWQIENKYDGIRVQLACNTQKAESQKALFSRTGDDISHAFPDLLEAISGNLVLDGELLVMHKESIDTFNALQQRLNKKKPSNALMKTFPAGMIVYDALVIEGIDLTSLPLAERRKKLQDYLTQTEKGINPRLHLSTTLFAASADELRALHQKVCQNRAVEGLMLKRLDSYYVPGRPKGKWYKWKRDAFTVDAVMMYAQRGHGKRSSFYSDYTFGAWQDDTLLPIGKAYSGFTDDELKKLDNWVRRNAIGRFGPVREVKKELVLEVAFDAVHTSSRHKSGVALRFPRIHRIRWDKPASEADTLETLVSLIDT